MRVGQGNEKVWMRDATSAEEDFAKGGNPIAVEEDDQKRCNERRLRGMTDAVMTAVRLQGRGGGQATG